MGTDAVKGAVLKYGGAVIDWMHIICNLAWKEEKAKWCLTKDMKTRMNVAITEKSVC